MTIGRVSLHNDTSNRRPPAMSARLLAARDLLLECGVLGQRGDVREGRERALLGLLGVRERLARDLDLLHQLAAPHLVVYEVEAQRVVARVGRGPRPQLGEHGRRHRSPI